MATPASFVQFSRCLYTSPRSISNRNASRASSSSFASCSCSCAISTSFPGKRRKFKLDALSAKTVSTSPRENFAWPRGIGMRKEPDHLLVLVHGILAGPNDWNYVQAELKKRLGKSFLIYASSCNTYTKTFTGIDGAGQRLAHEVMEVVQKTESLTKISFLAHSLGGLISRYAISVLYSETVTKNFPENGHKDSSTSSVLSSKRGTIAGLNPESFMTLATPHLGVRGKKQLPILLGIPFLERIAVPMAPFLVGRTGRQLFLTDGMPEKPPLLLRMASDSDDGKFLSALAAFKCRCVYANVSYDHMVGWRTSSIRRETELPVPPQRSLDGYKHVVDVEYCPPVPSEGPNFPPEAAKAKEAAQNEPNPKNTKEYHEIVEEEMIRGLQQLGWKKVDVSFHSTLWPFLAHNNIHVKTEWIHNAGTGVIAHVADSLKRQEVAPFFSARI